MDAKYQDANLYVKDVAENSEEGRYVVQGTAKSNAQFTAQYRARMAKEW